MGLNASLKIRHLGGKQTAPVVSQDTTLAAHQNKDENNFALMCFFGDGGRLVFLMFKKYANWVQICSQLLIYCVILEWLDIFPRFENVSTLPQFCSFRGAWVVSEASSVDLNLWIFKPSC